MASGIRGRARGCSDSPGVALPFPCGSVRELEERLWVAAVSRVARLQCLCRGRFAVRVRGGRVGTLAGAAARLRAGAGLLHFPSLGQRGLIDVLKAKPLSLVFVKGLGERQGDLVKAEALTFSWQLWLRAEDDFRSATIAPSCFGNKALKIIIIFKPLGGTQKFTGKDFGGLCLIKPARLSRRHDSNTSSEEVNPTSQRNTDRLMGHCWRLSAVSPPLRPRCCFY